MAYGVSETETTRLCEGQIFSTCSCGKKEEARLLELSQCSCQVVQGILDRLLQPPGKNNSKEKSRQRQNILKTADALIPPFQPIESGIVASSLGTAVCQKYRTKGCHYLPAEFVPQVRSKGLQMLVKQRKERLKVNLLPLVSRLRTEQ